jgi:hypothetical protein
MGAMMFTIYNIAQNSWARAFHEVEVGFDVGAVRGIVVGEFGGAGLGAALALCYLQTDRLPRGQS